MKPFSIYGGPAPLATVLVPDADAPGGEVPCHEADVGEIRVQANPAVDHLPPSVSIYLKAEDGSFIVALTLPEDVAADVAGRMAKAAKDARAGG